MKTELEQRKNKERNSTYINNIYNKNLITKKNITAEISHLLESKESIKETFKKFRILQKKWKNTGKVPLHKSDDIWKNYHHHVSLFYDYIKINHDLRDLDFKKNMEQKIIICKKAEKLLSEKSIKIILFSLQNLHDEWKEIGPVKKEQSKKIWQRFHKATKSIHEKRRKYFLTKHQEYNNNLTKKKNICKKILDFVSNTPDNHYQWQYLTEKMNSLSKEWKIASPIKKIDVKDSLLEFHNAKRNFLKARNKFYKNRKEQLKKDIEIKKSICKKVEKLSVSNNWKNSSKKLIDLQKEWTSTSNFIPKETFMEIQYWQVDSCHRIIF